MKIKKKIRLIRDTIQCLLLSGILGGLLSFLVVNMTVFNPFIKVLKDFSFLDVYYAENLGDNKAINSDIALINIEHRNRFELALLLEKINADNPKVVGVDALFKDLKEPFADSLLAAQLKSDKVIQAYIIDSDSLIFSHKYFQSKQKGFASLNFNNISVIREFIGVHTIDNVNHNSIASQIAKISMGDSLWSHLGYDKSLKGETPVNYVGNYDKFLTFNFDEYMENTEKGILKDKIVLIGYLGVPMGNPYDVEDKHFTPLNDITAGKSIPDMYGMVVHANIISMLINKSFLYRISNFWLVVITIICNFFLTMYFIYIDKTDKIGARTKRKITVTLFSIIILWISLGLFKYGIVLKVLPIIAFTIFASSVIKYYKHLIKYIQSKREWKSFI